MKRKLNEHDVPEEVVDTVSAADVTFESFGLDPRLLQAIAQAEYAAPTPVQAKAIPEALKGRDILARAKTGSGKTIAYVLPILNAILKRKTATPSGDSHVSALILVPTRELANQVTKAVTTICAFCARDVNAVNLTPQIHDQAQRALLASNPDIVVSTPARASLHLNTSTLNIDRLTHLVLDEADLVLSYGYEDDLKNIVRLMPQGVQTFLASATLTTDVESLQGLFCQDPVILDLQDGDKKTESITQYAVRCGEEEKWLLAFSLFKLKLIKGKCIVFVADVDRCYRLKLFLEQFGIKSCVLNSELPVNCRIHVVEEFNKNVYDIIIASDEYEVLGEGEKTKSKDDDDVDEGDAATTNGLAEARPKKKRKHVIHAPHWSDWTRWPQRHRHLVVIPPEEYRKHKPTSLESTKNDVTVLAAITSAQETAGTEIQPYRFDMDKLAGFAYRVASALKTVSPGAVREARVKELRQELLRSEKLKRHLEENPDDAQYLRHDKGKALNEVGYVGIGKTSDNRIRNARMRNKFEGQELEAEEGDPLKTFKAKSKN
ncbi:hypothetical protein MRB53_037627 [Persea americana]|nr:hypothetical protein MRB53_037627 [Persea americana]